jgi:microcystin degradation protein MlrC
VGETVPVVASLDYHANVTPQMVETADGFAIFLTYPHVDRPETGRRAAHILLELLERGRPRGRALRKPDFLIPITAQCTLVAPSRSIAGQSRQLEGELVSLAYAAGFPPSDLYWCGPAVIAHAFTQAEADRAADEMEAELLAAEAAFDAPLLSVAEGVRRALSAPPGRPVVIADVQDNPGGGGSADTTGIAAALIEAGAPDAVVGILCDPAAAEAAHRAGEGADIALALGGRAGPQGVIPLSGTFRVARLGDGNFRATGAVARGADVALGPMALLSIGGVDVVVSSRRMQAFDRAPFEHLGVDLPGRRVIVVKSSVHFRAEFGPLAQEVLLVAAPGLVPVASPDLPYKRLRDGVRLSPLGQAFSRR